MFNYDNWLSDDGCVDEDEERSEFDEDDRADYEYDRADYEYEKWLETQYD